MLSGFRHIFFASLAAATMIMMVSAGHALAQSEEKIEILVNDTPISGYDIAQRLRLMTVTTRQKPTAALRKKAVEELISESIQLQEARKNGVTVPAEDIDRALDRLGKQNNMTGQKLIAALQQLGVNSYTMRQRVEAQLAWQRFIRGKFRSQVSVGNSQIDKALSDQKPEEGQNSEPEKTELQLRRIRLELPGSPSQKKIAARLVEAEQLRSRITKCEQIEDAVRRFSDASVKDIGRKKAENYTQPSRAFLLAAKTGYLTPANITASGVELYAVCGRRSVRTNDIQRQKVQAQLLGQEYGILALRHLRDLRQEAYVEHR